ncbi:MULTISPECIES: chaplin [Streptomyces]|uniref:chaplin n=1 Tax=Streptomyces TaxID=1883 RepID=UPI001FE692BC|nr:chaplin [Streptomyces glaucescens]
MRTTARIAATVIAGAALALAAPTAATAGESGGGVCGSGGACAIGVAKHSPGVLSGNVVQIPVNAELNVCGNSVNIVGLLNPAVGNTCRN